MILFQAISMYHILEAIVLKEKYHKDEKSVLILNDFIENKFPNYYLIKEMDLFDEVYLVRVNHTDGRYIEKCEHAFEKVVPYSVFDFDRVYSFPGFVGVGAIMDHYNKKFYYGEDGIGFLTQKKLSYEFFSKYYPTTAKELEKRGMFSLESENIEKVVCNKRFLDEEGIKDLDIFDFDIFKEITESSKEFQDKLLKLFNIQDKIKGKKSILLTQQMANLKIVTYERQAYLYQVFCDFFMEGEDILVKHHPDDVLPYEKLLQDVKILDSSYPSELMNIIIEEPLNKVGTLYSSSYYGFLDNTIEENRIFLGYDINEYFDYIYNVFMSKEIIANVIKKANVKVIGGNEEIVKCIFNTTNSEINVVKEERLETINSDEVYLIFKELEEDEIELILNSKKRNIFFLKEYSNVYYNFYEDVDVFLVQKQKTREDYFYSNENQEQLLYLIDDNKLKEEIKKMKVSKDLKNSGIKLTNEQINEYEEKIAILKGELKASEELIKKLTKKQ